MCLSECRDVDVVTDQPLEGNVSVCSPGTLGPFHSHFHIWSHIDAQGHPHIWGSNLGVALSSQGNVEVRNLA